MQGQAHRNRSHQRLGVLQMPYCFILIAYRPWQGQSVISQDQPNLTAPFLEPAFRVNSGNPEKEQAALAKTRQNGGFFCHTRHHSGQPCRAFFMKLSSQSSPGLSRSVFSFRKAPSGSKRSKLLPNFFFILVVETRKCRLWRDVRGRKQLGPWHRLQGRENQRTLVLGRLASASA